VIYRTSSAGLFPHFVLLPCSPSLLCPHTQLERQQAAESTARKVVKEPPGSPAAPPQLTDECKVRHGDCCCSVHIFVVLTESPVHFVLCLSGAEWLLRTC
jgi:hypothetical protein